MDCEQLSRAWDKLEASFNDDAGVSSTDVILQLSQEAAPAKYRKLFGVIEVCLV